MCLPSKKEKITCFTVLSKQKKTLGPFAHRSWESHSIDGPASRGRLAVREMVLMNASAALYAAGKV